MIDGSPSSNDVSTSPPLVASTSTTPPPPHLARITIPYHGQQEDALGQQQQLPPPPNLNLTPSESSNTLMFRAHYDALLKEVLEEDDSSINDNTLMNSDSTLYTNNLHPFQQLDSVDIDLDTATADLPDELRAALEDRSLAEKYLANLKTFMSHQRSQSMGSMTSGKGDYSSPTTPLQPTFSIQSPSAAHHHPSAASSSAYYHRMQQDPLYKVLNAVPYQTRLINGVQSLWELQKKLVALKIPELDLPSVSDTVIKARLNDLYKVQDDLFIHLHGGPLVRNTHRLPIGDKKKREIDQLLDQVAKEIGLYEEFVKRDEYLSLESILNESDSSDEYQDSEIYETESSIYHHFDSPSIDATKSRSFSPTQLVHDRDGLSTPPPITKKPSATTLRRVTSQPTITNTFASTSPLITSSNPSVRRYDSSSGGAGSIHSYDAVSDPSLSQLLVNDDDDQRREKQDDIISEAFKWTPLVKISDHLYSKDIRRTSGLVSVLAVSGVIAVGTTRSLVYVYDYSQNLKCVLGDTVRAVEVGAVTSVAISADHTTIVCGHSQGHLVIWDIRKPQQPIRTIEPIPPNQTLGTTMSVTASSTQPIPSSPSQPGSSRKEGHVRGAAILHVGFIGIKKSEIVSGDDQGMAFYHVLYKVVMVNAVDTTRILGRYQNLSLPSSPSSSSTTTLNGRMSPQPSLARLGSSSSLLESAGPAFNKPRRPSTVFAMQALPLGQFAHPAENYGLVALLTPYKVIIVGLKPSCQTKFKFLKPKVALDQQASIDGASIEQQQQQQTGEDNQHKAETYHESLSGCLAWLPVTKATMSGKETGAGKDKKLHKELQVPSLEDPMLAYAWGNHLFIMRVGAGMSEPPPQHSPSRFRSPMGGGGSGGKRGTKLYFPKPAECQLEDSIIGLQWINRQILVLFTPNEEMLLFDPKKMMVTERASVRNKQLVYHDWFNAPLRDLITSTTTTTTTGVMTPGSNELDIGVTSSSTMTTSKVVEMAYYHSLKGYKGKLFLLGLDQIYVGTLLSWADRILALVRAGDFLDAIQLCTAFYNGKWTQTVVGLPVDEQQRKQLVGEKLMELLVASLNYAFSPSRRSMLLEEQQQQQQQQDLTTTNSIRPLMPELGESGADNTLLYQDLAKCCVDACLSMGDSVFLFETAYEQFADYGVQGLFLQVLESYIVTDQLRDLPPAVMKDLVTHYSSTRSRLGALERIIWHVQPQCLDIDQVVGVCQREGLYEAMMYVWNKSMDDFVSPLVEMLKVIRQCLKKFDEVMTATEGKGHYDTSMIQQYQQQRVQAEKVFDYLKMVLQGRTFPEGTMMRTSRGNEARSAVYSFVFSGRCVVWPRVGGKLILTVDENETMAEPTYPYLRLLLRFNTKKFLDALESAFEDPWLNGGDDMLTSTFEEDVLQGKVISRQIIVNTLLDVMGGSGMNNNSNNNNNSGNNGHLLAMPRLNPSFSASTVHSGVNGSSSNNNNNKGSGTSSETTSSYYDGSGDSNNNAAVSQNNHLLQLYIFIASNLHKYTTFIFLPLTTKQKILLQLTVNDMAGYYYYPTKHQSHHHHRRLTNDDSTKEERQRAVQQLLTVYTPSNEEAMTSLYEEAKFWNVLEDVYRRDKRYGKLVETYLKDTTPTRLHHHHDDDVDSPTNNGKEEDQDDEETITVERQHRVFNCVDWILDGSSPLTEHQRQDVKRVVLIRISQFVDMDGQRTADLIQKYFGADHHDILRRLDEDEEFEDDDEDEDGIQNGFEHDDNGGGKDDQNNTSRFPVTFARVADKRIFSYLRGLLEPQPTAAAAASATTFGQSTVLNSNGYNHNGTILEEDEEYVILNDQGGDIDSSNNNKNVLPTSSTTTGTHTIRRTNIDVRLQERYIDLMCRFDPSGVYDYLNTKLYDYDPGQQQQQQKEPGANDDIIDSDHDQQQQQRQQRQQQQQQQRNDDGLEHVNFDTLLKSCEKYGVMDAAVWIMEKMGNIQGALEKMLEVAKEKIQMILFIIRQQQQQQSWMFEDQGKISNGLIGLSGVLRVGIRLCENSSSTYNSNNDVLPSSGGDDEIESLWFRLLDVYVEASMEIHSALDKKKHPELGNLPLGVQQHVIYSFKSFVQSILTSLLLSTSPQVSLPRLLLRLIDSQTKGETTFADFRDIFLSMLDTYKYEGQLLALTNRLFDRDLFLGVQDMVRQRGKGWRPQAMTCSSCGVGILDLSLMQPRLWQDDEEGIAAGDDDKPLMVFHCGHVFHRQCLDQNNSGDYHLCTLCNTPPPPPSTALDKGKSKATALTS